MADIIEVDRTTTVTDDTGSSFAAAWIIGLVVVIGLIIFAVVYTQQPRTAVDTSPSINIQSPAPAPSTSTPSVIPIPIPIPGGSGPSGPAGPSGPSGSPGAAGAPGAPGAPGASAPVPSGE